MPSYKGPDKHCFTSHNEFMIYLGRLQERSYLGSTAGAPPLDRADGLPGAELQPGDPIFEFIVIPQIGNSLIGQARDAICELALNSGCDYVFFFDDDMIFARDTFLRLWRRQKPFVGALAFTAREPIAPVLYELQRSFSVKKQYATADVRVIFDYPKDELFQIDAMGTGVVLISTECFKKVPKPWFNASITAGEDVHFCLQLYKAGIPVFCDTSVKTYHVPNSPVQWMDEDYYLRSKEQSRRWYLENRGAA